MTWGPFFYWVSLFEYSGTIGNMDEREKKANRRENGTFGPGNNAGGRKKGRNWSNHLRDMTEAAKEGGVSDMDAILGKLVELAKKGEPWAIQCVLDRLEGKATQKIEQEITEVPSASVSFKGKGKVTPIPKADDKATG